MSRPESPACPCGGDGCTGPDDGERHVCATGNACGVAGCATCGGVASTAAEIVAAMPEPLRRLAADPEARAAFSAIHVAPDGLPPDIATFEASAGRMPATAAPPPPSLADAVIAALQAVPCGKLAPPWRTRESQGFKHAERGTVCTMWTIGRECDDVSSLAQRMAKEDVTLRAAGYVLTEDVVRAVCEAWERRREEEVRELRNALGRAARLLESAAELIESEGLNCAVDKDVAEFRRLAGGAL